MLGTGGHCQDLAWHEASNNQVLTGSLWLLCGKQPEDGAMEEAKDEAGGTEVRRLALWRRAGRKWLDPEFLVQK